MMMMMIIIIIIIIINSCDRTVSTLIRLQATLERIILNTFHRAEEMQKRTKCEGKTNSNSNGKQANEFIT
jgi:hypothetical protein